MPFASFAQEAKLWRVGILSPRHRPTTPEGDHFATLRVALRELGYVEGQNIAFEERVAQGDYERLPALAAELVKLKADVIVTAGTPAVEAAWNATKKIPIVAATFADPVGSGFAKSLARPGGNITGLTNSGEELETKRLELLTRVAPSATRIANLVNPQNAAVMRRTASLEAVAQKFGKELITVLAPSVDDFDDAFARMARERVSAVMIASDSFFSAQCARLAGLANRYKLPAIYSWKEHVEAGALLSYAIEYHEQYRRAATYVHRILKGAKAGELPIEQPSKFELAVNLKTAKALGIAIPPTILLQADRVIE